MKHKHILIVSSLTIITLLVVGLVAREKITQYIFEPRNSSTSEGVDLQNQAEPDIQIMAKNLSVPWAIAFLPDGSLLVTERRGRLLKIDNETQVIQEIADVVQTSEGGLMGVAVHPQFDSNHWIYLFYTYRNNGETLMNRLDRFELNDDILTNQTTILDDIEGAKYHDGGRIAFGPDGYLYITTGDAQKTELAQDQQSLNGKILRIKDDGSIPNDNPFGNAIYSIGHRNPQGIAWDNQGRLWSSEHGPSGLDTGYDEINLIIPGKNYGWPTIKGDKTATDLVTPAIQSGSEDTWAPAGMAILNDTIFFAGLRGESLYQATISGESVTNLKANFKEELGRLRAVTLGPDDYLYISTSNTDGRGTPNENDDKILKINPAIFRSP